MAVGTLTRTVTTSLCLSIPSSARQRQQVFKNVCRDEAPDQQTAPRSASSAFMSVCASRNRVGARRKTYSKGVTPGSAAQSATGGP